MLGSAAILAALGAVHLLYTFRGRKLRPRDPAVEAAMARAQMGITDQTTVWRAWIGFNASHSLGAILFGLVYGFLALCQPELLFGSTYLLLLGFAMLTALLALARAYWFRVPFAGLAIALAAYVTGVVIARS
ncbi:LIC_13387 family protein [Solimonas variicoloris]|uniref:LIC_13387 family protein n=1 Tax=Solimonas variicoloris TaxID=254408 RepID=UPI000377DD68|nr:hypothetical protein [Solimonas variicoloris]